MEKKHKNPLGNFCPRVPIMHAIDSCSARSKYHLTIKKPCMYAFLRIFSSYVSFMEEKMSKFTIATTMNGAY